MHPLLVRISTWMEAMVSKIGSTVHYSIKDQVVRIRPTTPEAKAAVAKYGNLFWKRPLSSGGVYLIPVPGGIPLVHAFIIIPSEDVINDQSEVGYGSSSVQGGPSDK